MQPNPYVGPRSFQTGETLYGRDREARELLGLLVAERIVLLYSPSGAGKSSLVQAALIPRLLDRDFFVRPVVRVNLDTGGGGNRYLRATLLSLEEGAPEGEQLPLADLVGLSLDAYLARRPPPADADGEVLIFDQFEEILTADPTDAAAKRAFFEQVGAALRNRNRWALFSMREDYIAALDPYVGAIPTRLNTTFRLDLLGLDAAQEVMRRPALAAGVEFAAEAADRLAGDLSRVLVQRPDGALEEQRGPHVEPVQLQVVCYRLWDGLPDDADRIGLAEVAALGDVNRALANYYAAGVARTAEASGVKERAVREWFDRQLITPQGIRGTVLQGPADSQGLPSAAVRPLVDAYLVRGEKRRGATWLELAHDRLIEPVRDDNAAWFAAHLSPLQRQADLWDQQGRPSGLLLREEALAEAEAWAADNAGQLTATEAAFLQACREARAAAERERRQARRIRLLAIGASILSLLALTALAAALVFFGRSEQQRRAANVRAAAASALANLTTDPALSIIIASAAVRSNLAAGDPLAAEAREALLQASQASRGRRIVSAYPPEAALRGLQSVAYSPDGSRLAAASNAGELLIYDAATGEELERLQGDPDGLNGVTYSPDGGRIAAAGLGGAVRVWNTLTGEELLALDGHPDGALEVAFSPDSARVVTTGNDPTPLLWDASTGEQLLALEGHGDIVNSAAFSPDGALLVTASDDNTARIWDAATAAELHVLVGHAGWVLDAAFSPDRQTVATVGDDQTLRLWDVESGLLLDTLRGHDTTIDSVSFSGDGKLIATGSSDTTARVWDFRDRKLILTLAGHDDAVSGVAFSPAGLTLATSSQDGTLRLWDLALAPPGGAYFLAYSPDGARLATAGFAGAQLWNPATGEGLAVVETQDDGTAVAFSPDGRSIAVGTVGSLLLLADAANGAIRAEWEENPLGVNRLAFSPDGSLLAAAGADGVVRLWNPADATEAARTLPLRPDEAAVFSVAFSPDGGLLAAGDEYGAVAVWDAASGERRLELEITDQQSVNSLAFSPDSRLLAAADEEGVAWVWDAASGAEVRRLQARAPVLALAFSPDGAQLATAGRDQAVTLWRTATWEQALRLPHPSAVNNVSFRPDGLWLATAADDGQARVLPLRVEDLLALADARTLRGPTPEECEAYRLTEGCRR